MMQKTWKMTEILTRGYSSESTQRELSNEYQHDMVKMVFRNLRVLVLLMNVAWALEVLRTWGVVWSGLGIIRWLFGLCFDKPGAESNQVREMDDELRCDILPGANFGGSFHVETYSQHVPCCDQTWKVVVTVLVLVWLERGVHRCHCTGLIRGFWSVVLEWGWDLVIMHDKAGDSGVLKCHCP